MKVSDKQFAKLLFDLVDGKKSEDVALVIDRYFKLLIKEGKVQRVGKILDEFDKVWDDSHGVVNAIVTSGSELNLETSNRLMQFIKIKTNANKVLIKNIIDKDKVLGGVLIECGERVIDACLKTRVNDLRLELVK